MFGKRWTLFKLFGFEVRIDVSWILLALLITFTLATGFFPNFYANWLDVEPPAKWTFWIMGVFGAVGLFLSIIFHEMCHSLVARRHGMPMEGITLFIFGGVAEMDEEPPTAKSEFLMAIAGPISSVVMGVVFGALWWSAASFSWPTSFLTVFAYLSIVNVLLACFNMMPAFPLDGGRVIRSALWMWKKDIRWATRISSKLGGFFGLGLIFLGILQFFVNPLGGFWLFLIGLFIRHASQMSFQRLVMRQSLEGEAVRRFMKTDPVTAPPSITIEELVEDYIYRHHFKIFPVVDENGELQGCITTREVKEIPREEWSQRTVGDVVKQCSPENTIRADADATEALETIHKTDNSRLMVTEDGKLVGILALKDLLKFLSLKMDLESGDVPAGGHLGAEQ